MAERYAANAGNWSNVATWDGGVSLPGAGDDVYANNKAVTIDQTVNVLSLRNTAGVTAVAGGGFTADTAQTITADIYPGSAIPLTVSHATGVVTLNGDVMTGSSNNISAVSHTGAGQLTVVGDVTPGTLGSSHGINSNGTGDLHITGTIRTILSASNSSWGVRISGSKTITIVGSLLCALGASGVHCLYFATASTCTLNFSGGEIRGALGTTNSSGISFFAGATYTINIVGDLIGGGGNNSNGIIINACTIDGTITGNILSPYATGATGINAGHIAGTITINGNVTGGIGTALAFSGTGTAALIVNGDVTGGLQASNSQGISNSCASPASLTINGDVYSGFLGPGLQASGSGATIINGDVIHASNQNSVTAVNIINSHPLTVNGDVYGGAGLTTAHGLTAANTAVFTINGKAIAGPGYSIAPSAGVSTSSTATGNYIKEVVGNNYPNDGATFPNNGVLASAATIIVTVGSVTFGTGGVSGLSPVGRFFIDDAAPNVFTGRTSAGDKVVMSDTAAPDYPAIANVRTGTIYALTTLTGTCAIPVAASVVSGVPVDAAVGTGSLSPQRLTDSIGPLLAALGV